MRRDSWQRYRGILEKEKDLVSLEKCHKLHGAWTKKGNVKKEAFEFIEKVHDELVKEMLRRKINHKTPLEVSK